MQFTTTVFALLAAASASVATPVPAEAATNMMAAATPQWTIENFTRTCNGNDSNCKYSFGINTNNGQKVTGCSYSVNGKPASRATYQNIQCGAFRIGSTWSGQFGAGQGFQTLSVVKDRQIVYPAYTDKQLVNGKTVKPNQSYAPQNLP
ncbi:hypothetical protein CBER1_07926 [Cercospora berteroae]|uniref:Small secreted protein n=1 Tax=Cercospora berteroae TaxID=357750 RepID=A0A2S6CC86_9PEZI|nr:hypothetical protein CBER1_07926 [Cercospora berteroae]